MHDGRFATIEEVIDHYREPPPGGPGGPNGQELLPFALSSEEAAALASFLATLDGEVHANSRWLARPTQTAGTLPEARPSTHARR